MPNSAANEINSVEIPSTAFSVPRGAEDEPGKACRKRDSPTKAGVKELGETFCSGMESGAGARPRLVAILAQGGQEMSWDIGGSSP